MHNADLLFGRADDRHEPHPLSLIRDGKELLPVPTPVHDRRYPIERPTDERERLVAVTSDRNLAVATRPEDMVASLRAGRLVDPDRWHGDGIIAEVPDRPASPATQPPSRPIP